MISKILKVFPFKQNKYLNNCIIFLYNLIKINLSPAKKTKHKIQTKFNIVRRILCNVINYSEIMRY